MCWISICLRNPLNIARETSPENSTTLWIKLTGQESWKISKIHIQTKFTYLLAFVVSTFYEQVSSYLKFFAAVMWQLKNKIFDLLFGKLWIRIYPNKTFLSRDVSQAELVRRNVWQRLVPSVFALAEAGVRELASADFMCQASLQQPNVKCGVENYHVYFSI